MLISLQFLTPKQCGSFKQSNISRFQAKEMHCCIGFVLNSTPSPCNEVEESTGDRQKKYYAKIVENYEEGKYLYEIVVDSGESLDGDKTHIAAVRRNLITGVEVSDNR